MADAFDNYAPGLDAPASHAFAITPGASALANVTRRLYVGGAGNVTVTLLSGVSLTFVAVPAGEELDVRVTHVTAATATGLVGLTDPAAAEAPADNGDTLDANAVTYDGQPVTYNGVQVVYSAGA